jgi:hypothetical protein
MSILLKELVIFLLRICVSAIGSLTTSKRSHGYMGMRKWIIQYWRRRHCSSEKLGKRLETNFTALKIEEIGV